MENLNKLTKLLGADRIMTADDIQQILLGIMEILKSYKEGTESINEETKAVVNILLDKVVQSNKQTIDKAETVLDDRMNDLETLLKDVKQMITDVEVLASEVKDGKDADEEKVVENVISRIKLEPTIVTLSAEEVRDRLSSLKDDARLDKSAIKGLDKVLQQSDLDYAIATLQRQTSFLINRGGVKSLTAGTNITITDNGGGDYTIASSGGGGTPGGSDTQLQYNNAGAFGGISGATTDGTAVTYTANNLKAADITASGSGGFLIQSNSGTDVGLFGAGGGAGATFYGGVNIDGNLTVDTNTLYVDATNNVVGIGTASPLTQTGNVLQVGSTAAVNQYLVFQTNNGTERGIQYYLLDGTTLRGYMKWDTEEDLLLKGDTLKISTQNVTNPFHFGDGGGIGLFGIGTTAPTHSLTLNSTSTGIALYNTADQTTNYERMEGLWSSNEFLLRMAKGGTGTQRNVKLVSHGILTIAGSASSSGDFIFIGSTSGANTVNIVAGSTYTATSGVNTEVSIKPVINQSSTAGYTALLVNPTETTTGSGSKLLADFQVGGVSKFNVANTGITTITNTVDAASNQVMLIQGDRATPANNDEIYQSFSMSSSTGVQREFARIQVSANDVTNASEDGQIVFHVVTAGTLGKELVLVGTSLFPEVNDGLALGTSTKGYADLFLASGGVINFNNGNATLTHSTGLITSNVPVAASQIYNADQAATVTTNAATITRAFRNNTFTNSSAAAMTITLSTTGATAGDMLLIQIYDFSAAAQTITWVNTENSDVSVPATSNGSTTLPRTVGFKWNSATSKWRCMMNI